MADIRNPRLLYLKGTLLLGLGILASALLLIENPNLRTAALWWSPSGRSRVPTTSHSTSSSTTLTIATNSRGSSSFLRYLRRRRDGRHLEERWIHAIDSYLAGTGMIAASAVAAIAGLILMRRFGYFRTLIISHEASGQYLSSSARCTRCCWG